MSCVLFVCCPATQPTNTRRHAIPKKMSPRQSILRAEKQQCCQAVLCALQAITPAAVLCSVMFQDQKPTFSTPQKQTTMHHVVILVFGSGMHFNIFLPLDFRCVLIHCKVHSQCLRTGWFKFQHCKCWTLVKGWLPFYLWCQIHVNSPPLFFIFIEDRHFSAMNVA